MIAVDSYTSPSLYMLEKVLALRKGATLDYEDSFLGKVSWGLKVAATEAGLLATVIVGVFELVIMGLLFLTGAASDEEGDASYEIQDIIKLPEVIARPFVITSAAASLLISNITGNLEAL